LVLFSKKEHSFWACFPLPGFTVIYTTRKTFGGSGFQKIGRFWQSCSQGVFADDLVIREMSMFRRVQNGIAFAPSLQGSILAHAFAEWPLGFVDIGARGGVHGCVLPIAQWTSVLAFEPDAEACRSMLDDPAIAAPWAAFRLEPIALGERDEVARLHLMAAPTNHSLLPGNLPLIDRYKMERFTPAGSATLQTTSLDQFLFNGDVAPETGELIKIDTQGSELMILRGARRTLEERTVAVMAEVEFCQIYKDQPLFSELELYLRGLGFSFYGFQSMHLRSGKRIDKRRADGMERVLWAEAVFFKDPLGGSDQHVRPGERQMMALMLSAMLFGYFDFAAELAQTAWPGTTEAERIAAFERAGQRRSRSGTAGGRDIRLPGARCAFGRPCFDRPVRRPASLVVGL